MDIKCTSEDCSLIGIFSCCDEPSLCSNHLHIHDSLDLEHKKFLSFIVNPDKREVLANAFKEKIALIKTRKETMINLLMSFSEETKNKVEKFIEGNMKIEADYIQSYDLLMSDGTEWNRNTEEFLNSQIGDGQVFYTLVPGEEVNFKDFIDNVKVEIKNPDCEEQALLISNLREELEEKSMIIAQMDDIKNRLEEELSKKVDAVDIKNEDQEMLIGKLQEELNEKCKKIDEIYELNLKLEEDLGLKSKSLFYLEEERCLEATKLQVEIEEKSQKIAELAEINSKLEEELNKIPNFDCAAEDQRMLISKLQDEIQEKTEKISEVTEENINLKGELDIKSKELASVTEENCLQSSKLHEELQETHRRMSEIADINSKLEHEIEKLNEKNCLGEISSLEITKLQEELQEKSQKIIEMAEEHEKIVKELLEENSKTENFFREKMIDLENVLNDKNNELSKAYEHIEELKNCPSQDPRIKDDEIKELIESNNELREQIQENDNKISGFFASIKELEDQLANKNNKITKLHKKIENFKRKIKETKEKLIEKIENKDNEIENLVKELKEAQENIEKVNESNKIINELEGNVQDAEERLLNAVIEIDSLNFKIKEIEEGRLADSDMNNSLINQLKETEKDFVAINQEIKVKDLEIEKLVLVLRELETEKASIQDNLDNQIQNILTEMNIKNEEINAYITEVKSKNTELAEKAERIQDLHAELEQATIHAHKQAEEIQLKTTEIDNKITEIQEIYKEIQLKDLNLQNLSAELQLKNNELLAQEKKISSLTSQMQDSLNENNALLVAKDKEIKNLQNQLSKPRPLAIEPKPIIQADSKSQIEEIKSLSTKLKLAESKIKSQENEIFTLKEDLKNQLKATFEAKKEPTEFKKSTTLAPSPMTVSSRNQNTKKPNYLPSPSPSLLGNNRNMNPSATINSSIKPPPAIFPSIPQQTIPPQVKIGQNSNLPPPPLTTPNIPPPPLITTPINIPPPLLVLSDNPPPPLLVPLTSPPPPLFGNQNRSEPPQLYVKKQSSPNRIENATNVDSEKISSLEQKIIEITAEKKELDKKINEISKEYEEKVQKLTEEQEEYKKLIDEEKNRNKELMEKQEMIEKINGEGNEEEKQRLCGELEIVKYDKEIIESFLVQNIRKNFNFPEEPIQEFKLFECQINYVMNRDEQYYAEILVDKLHFYGNQDGINSYDENSQYVESLEHRCTSGFKGFCASQNMRVFCVLYENELVLYSIKDLTTTPLTIVELNGLYTISITWNGRFCIACGSEELILLLVGEKVTDIIRLSLNDYVAVSSIFS